MTWEAWATLVVIGIMMLLLVRNLAGPDTTLFGGLILLIIMGLFSDGLLPTPVEAITGYIEALQKDGLPIPIDREFAPLKEKVSVAVPVL